MRHAVKQFMLPIRKAANWFVNPIARESPPSHVANRDSIIYKAASFAAINKIQGDYLEFGVFRGGSFISAYYTLRYCFDEVIKSFGFTM